MNDARTPAMPVLSVRNLTKHFPVKKGLLAREVAVSRFSPLMVDLKPRNVRVVTVRA